MPGGTDVNPTISLLSFHVGLSDNNKKLILLDSFLTTDIVVHLRLRFFIVLLIGLLLTLVKLFKLLLLEKVSALAPSFHNMSILSGLNLLSLIPHQLFHAQVVHKDVKFHIILSMHELGLVVLPRQRQFRDQHVNMEDGVQIHPCNNDCVTPQNLITR